MTLTKNLHMGLVSWSTNTNYKIGNRVLNAANCYQAISNGTSSVAGGPSGVANNIIDGTLTWKYISPVDYSGTTGDAVFLAATNDLLATFTQNVIWQCWNSNNGKPIATAAAGTNYIFLDGHTIPPFSLTIMCAPGESVKDSLFLNKTPLFTANAQYGLTFQFPSTGQGGINYFEIRDSNVTIDGFQFIDPQIYSQSSMFNSYGLNTYIQNCIFDGNGQNNGASMVATGSPPTGTSSTTFKNCLFIDRQLANYYPDGEPGTTVSFGATNSYAYNCGLISYLNAGSTAQALRADAPAWANNCYVFGYTWNFFSSSLGIKNVVTDYSVVPGTIDGGGNLLNQSANNCFVSFPNNLEVKNINSPLIQHSTTPTTFNPDLDLSKNERPSSKNWDNGPVQYVYNHSFPSVLGITYS